MTGHEAVEAVVRARTGPSDLLCPVHVYLPRRSGVVTRGGVLHRELVFVVNGTILSIRSADISVDVYKRDYPCFETQEHTADVAVGSPQVVGRCAGDSRHAHPRSHAGAGIKTDVAVSISHLRTVGGAGVNQLFDIAAAVTDDGGCDAGTTILAGAVINRPATGREQG